MLNIGIEFLILKLLLNLKFGVLILVDDEFLVRFLFLILILILNLIFDIFNLVLFDDVFLVLFLFLILKTFFNLKFGVLVLLNGEFLVEGK